MWTIELHIGIHGFKEQTERGEDQVFLGKEEDRPMVREELLGSQHASLQA